MTILWIGMYEVRALPGNDALDGMAGAFVNVVALALDVEDFERRACVTLEKAGLEVVCVTDVGTIEERERRGDLVDELGPLARSLTEENPVRFDEFQAYER